MPGSLACHSRRTQTNRSLLCSLFLALKARLLLFCPEFFGHFSSVLRLGTNIIGIKLATIGIQGNRCSGRNQLQTARSVSL